MAKFDRLPETIRQALHESKADYPIHDVFAEWEQYGTRWVLDKIRATEAGQGRLIAARGGAMATLVVEPPPVLLTDEEILRNPPPRRLNASEIDRKLQLLMRQI